jgi:hypothetical protein
LDPTTDRRSFYVAIGRRRSGVELVLRTDGPSLERPVGKVAVSRLLLLAK